MSELSAPEWNARYPIGTPALLGDRGSLVYAGGAFVVDNTPLDPWVMVCIRQTGLDGTVVMSGSVSLESITPLATDEARREQGWLDPTQAGRWQVLWPPEWWFHQAHGLHDQAHHEAHRPMDVCVPLIGARRDGRV